MNRYPMELARRIKKRLLHDTNALLIQIQSELAHLGEKQGSTEHSLREVETKLRNSGTFNFSDTEVITKIFSGAKFYLDPRDRAVVPHLILDGEWEHNITNAWLTLVGEDQVIMDIGANFGYFGVLAAQKSNKKSKVTLFEPNPELAPYIRKTLEVNSLNECVGLESIAVGSAHGRVVLNIPKDYIGCSTIHTTDYSKAHSESGGMRQIEKKVTVDCITLDEFCTKKRLKKLDLIKMDIEGYEEKAYEGMRKIVDSSPDLSLFIEFTASDYERPKQFFEKLYRDFGNVYNIDSNGGLRKYSKEEYWTLLKKTKGWEMPVFSKRPNLDKRRITAK